jgi:alpha-tubulin suppressor-like RCC1 family protein
VIQRRSRTWSVHVSVWATLGTLLMLACSSSESGGANTDGADGGPGAPDGSAADSGGEAGDAGKLEPPPYDFAVKCTADPCVTQIAARGGTHICALFHDGSVRCWGSNASGQLGQGAVDAGPMTGHEATPRSVRGIANAKALAATGQGTSGTTCVVSGAGEVVCFGSDRWGQLGRSSGSANGPNPQPEAVEGIQAKAVTLTSTFALAIGTDDHLWSWGSNDTHQLARDMTAPDAGSGEEAARADRISPSVRSCAGTAKTGFIVAEDGALLSWGGGPSEQLGRATSLTRDPVPAALALSNVLNVTAGAAHACALVRGAVHCWGDNAQGQLGTGRKADETLPAGVALPADVYPVFVAAGANNTCVIAADGDVYCWGANGSGQLGTSPGVDQAMPVRIDELGEETVAVAVMDDAICALLRGGSVVCWGDNLLGQLGRGRRDVDIHAQPGPVVFK